MDLRYRAPVWVYGFYFAWYLFLAFFAVGLVASGWAPDVEARDKAMTVAIFALLLGAPVGLHAVGTRHSDDELGELLEFLAQHAEAKG